MHSLPAPTVAAAPEFYVSIDGTGVPMVPPELEGRAGKGADGQAKTREVKLAAFFTRTKVDAEGRPVRDPDSTTYLASFAGSDEFGPLARQAALAARFGRGHPRPFSWRTERRGPGKSPAPAFPRPFKSWTYYHASEHVVALAQAVYADPGRPATGRFAGKA